MHESSFVEKLSSREVKGDKRVEVSGWHKGWLV